VGNTGNGHNLTFCLQVAGGRWQVIDASVTCYMPDEMQLYALAEYKTVTVLPCQYTIRPLKLQLYEQR
jgi:hypothetical protein